MSTTQTESRNDRAETKNVRQEIKSNLPPLEELDRDGAIQETAANVDSDTRGAFLKKAGVGVGALAIGGAFAGAIPNIARGATIPRATSTSSTSR